jgi:hypothetical protein
MLKKRPIYLIPFQFVTGFYTDHYREITKRWGFWMYSGL